MDGRELHRPEQNLSDVPKCLYRLRQSAALFSYQSFVYRRQQDASPAASHSEASFFYTIRLF